MNSSPLLVTTQKQKIKIIKLTCINVDKILGETDMRNMPVIYTCVPRRNFAFSNNYTYINIHESIYIHTYKRTYTYIRIHTQYTYVLYTYSQILKSMTGNDKIGYCIM